MKKFLKHVWSYFKPESKDDMVYQEAHSLTGYLTSVYSVEEQTDIVNRMRDALIVHRHSEILQTENYLERLKESLNDLKPTDHEG